MYALQTRGGGALVATNALVQRRRLPPGSDSAMLKTLAAALARDDARRLEVEPVGS